MYIKDESFRVLLSPWLLNSSCVPCLFSDLKEKALLQKIYSCILDYTSPPPLFDLQMHFRSRDILQHGMLRLISRSQPRGRKRRGSTNKQYEKSLLCFQKWWIRTGWCHLKYSGRIFNSVLIVNPYYEFKWIYSYLLLRC